MQWKVTVIETSELVLFKNFLAQMAVSKSREENLKVVQRGYDQFWMALTGATMRVPS